MWFKAKMLPLNKSTKRVLWPSALSDLLFIVPKIINGGCDPHWRETIPEEKKTCEDTAGWFKLTSCSIESTPFHWVIYWQQTTTQGVMNTFPDAWCDSHLYITFLEDLLRAFFQGAAITGEKHGSYCYFDFLWLSLLVSTLCSSCLHSLCTFFRDNKVVGHLPVWICSLCSQTNTYKFTFYTFQICPVGDYIPSNMYAFHGLHPTLSCQHFP